LTTEHDCVDMSAARS